MLPIADAVLQALRAMPVSGIWQALEVRVNASRCQKKHGKADKESQVTTAMVSSREPPASIWDKVESSG